MLTIVIGQVGSGKSSLLLSLMNEINNNSEGKRLNGSFAYVE